MMSPMSRQTRWFLAGVVVVALAVMAYDASAPLRLGTPATAPVTPSVESPRSETQRGLDKTPLIYPAQFVDTLVERLRGALVVAVPIPSGASASGLIVAPGDIVIGGAGDAQTWRVTTATGRILTATRVGVDPVRGVMLLRSETPSLATVPFGPPALASGSPVVALSATPTALVTQLLPAPGTEASLYARLRSERLAPGTAVVDLDGRLMAMLGAGVHGGVPLTSEDLQTLVLPALRTGTYVGLPWIGADLQDLTPPLRSRFGEGVMVVAHVEPRSPADEAGLLAGDVVRTARVGDVEVSTAADFEARIHADAPVSLEVARGARRTVMRTVAIDVGRRAHPPGVEGASGIAVADTGVVVDVGPASAAARAGLRTGDRIEAVDGRLATPGVVSTVLRGSREVLLLVRREGRHFLVLYPPGDAAS
jgi:serine protease DegQ